MNVLLWFLQVALALFYLAGGQYKVFHFDELVKVPPAGALSRGEWGGTRCVRDVVRGPTGCTSRHQVDVFPDPACRRRANARKRCSRFLVRAVFARITSYQPIDLRCRRRVVGSIRGLRSVRAEAIPLMLRSRTRTSV